MAACKARIELVLERALTLPDPGTARLREAMRYSVLGGGKRLRPTLVYLTGESLGASPEELDAPAAAVELIHVYSLVHDDLPAMDDDDLRRGHPTCHRAYDEGTAVLVGDALQAGDMADRAQGRAADLAYALGDGVGGGENLFALLVEQQVIIAEVRPGYVPVEILRFHV